MISLPYKIAFIFTQTAQPKLVDFLLLTHFNYSVVSDSSGGDLLLLKHYYSDNESYCNPKLWNLSKKSKQADAEVMIGRT